MEYLPRGSSFPVLSLSKMKAIKRCPVADSTLNYNKTKFKNKKDKKIKKGL